MPALELLNFLGMLIETWYHQYYITFLLPRNKTVIRCVFLTNIKKIKGFDLLIT